jgi:O-antigen/teichoic acid export membrane protein
MRERLKRALPDLLIAAFLLIIPLIVFFPQTVGGRTLLPVDNLFQFEPYASLAADYGIEQPHNGLISDLILENYAWKRFALRQIKAGEIPLWQPYIVAGAPFLAAGQSSTLYPFSLLFLILPLSSAYGWFTVSQLWLAAVNMYILARVLGVRRIGAAIAALAYQLSGFYLVSVVFAMIIAAAAWLPLELAMIELTIRRGKALGGRPATIPWVAVGAGGLGMAALAGHVEALYFTLLVMAFYAAWRLIAGVIAARREPGTPGKLLGRALWLIAMVGLGLALGAVQIIPSYELASRSFREGAVSLAQVRDWAYPARRVIAFLMPNFFGNPSHHHIFDVFAWRRVPVTVNALGEAIDNTHWGIKNYVEGGAYLGILPMALALLAVLHWVMARIPRKRTSVLAAPPDDKTLAAEGPGRPYRVIFAVLAALSVSFVFGTPTYALLYYGLPFINQSHSPFRWVWPLTVGVAVLAGFGVQLLQTFVERLHDRAVRAEGPTPTQQAVAITGWVCVGAGGLILLALILSRIFYGGVEGIVQRAFEGLALAPTAFPDGRAFYSYQAVNALVLAVMLALTGAVLVLSQQVIHLPIPGALKRVLPLRGDVPLWLALAPLVVAVDLGIATWGFYPANDPTLLDVVPPAVAWLKERAAEDSQPWRFIAYEEPGADTMNSNIGWLHDLQDASGYDSLIPGQYADYMRVIQPQDDLAYNRVAPLYSTHPDALDSPLLDVLNVKYVVTEVEIDNPKYELVYEDEAVRIYENLGAMPRAFTLPFSTTSFYRLDDEDDPPFADEVAYFDLRHNVLIPAPPGLPRERNRASMPTTIPGTPVPATVTVYTANEVWIDAQVRDESWLVLADSAFPGWKAYLRPIGAGDADERQVPLHVVDGNFRGVYLERGAWTVRMKYSPDSVKLGGFASFMAGVVLIFVVGVWLWRYVYRESPHDSTMRRVAKNSFAPIVLNLFNRAIMFAFAFIMLRILGPEGSGKYQFAVVIWGWFEIVSNFGLDTFLVREVARHRDDANRYLVNTSIMRMGLALLGVPVLAGFIAAWQRLSAVETLALDPLAADTVIAMWLLYAGLFLSTLSKGLTGLFYAYEQAEYPAAITTISTILTASLGVIALLLGYGIVGLAGVSIAVNAITLVILAGLATRQFFRPRPTFDWRLQRGAMGESFPLMINHLLATIFFRLDIVLLRALKGAVVVGWYGVVYKWIDALNVIPSFFTQALFPVMSRQAQEDREALRSSYILSIKLLSLISLPVAVVTTLLATFLVGLLGGPEFLPHGAIALQIFVWSIPIGWINSVTNYVIIALNRQRILTWAFVLGVLFNVATNLVFIPRYSYPAAAVIAILSELVLLTFFYLVMRPALGGVPWARVLWRIAAATALMGGATWALAQVGTGLALVGGGVVYVGAVLLLRPFTAEEMRGLAPLIPARVRGRLLPGVAVGD